MPTNLDDNELLLRCSCGSKEHIAWLTYEPEFSRGNNLKEAEDDWYLAIGLDRFGFWKRQRIAFNYLFRPHANRFGAYIELVLKNDDVDKLADFITRRLAQKHLDEIREQEAADARSKPVLDEPEG